MFDIGFPELLIVSIVALLVLGPERLPETVRTIGLWVGRIRRMFSDVKADIEREIGADEIRQQIHNETILKELKQAEHDIKGITQQPVENLAKNSLDRLVSDSTPATPELGTPSMTTTPERSPTNVQQTDSKHENDSIKSN